MKARLEADRGGHEQPAGQRPLREGFLVCLHLAKKADSQALRSTAGCIPNAGRPLLPDGNTAPPSAEDGAAARPHERRLLRRDWRRRRHTRRGGHRSPPLALRTGRRLLPPRPSWLPPSRDEKELTCPPRSPLLRRGGGERIEKRKRKRRRPCPNTLGQPCVLCCGTSSSPRFREFHKRTPWERRAAHSPTFFSLGAKT